MNQQELANSAKKENSISEITNIDVNAFLYIFNSTNICSFFFFHVSLLDPQYCLSSFDELEYLFSSGRKFVPGGTFGKVWRPFLVFTAEVEVLLACGGYQTEMLLNILEYKDTSFLPQQRRIQSKLLILYLFKIIKHRLLVY